MEEKNIIKPLSVARADFVSSLAELINNSMLPPIIIEPIIKDIYNEISALSQRQLEKDREEYEAKLKEEVKD